MDGVHVPLTILYLNLRDLLIQLSLRVNTFNILTESFLYVYLKLHLARLDLAEKRIGRVEFLREMKRGANVRSRAMAMIGTYSTVSAHALKNMLLRDG